MEEDKKEGKTTHFGRKIVPEKEKEGLVREVFDTVASKYDLMNDLMSLGTHRLWKKDLARETRLRAGQLALDVAGGTGDIALLMARQVGPEGRVVVYDINHEMLSEGKKKCVDRGVLKGLDFVQGNGESISFPDNTFHAVTVGFGIRNVTHLERAFSEMTRVVKPGGRVICLEFSHVKNPVMKKLYDAYSFSVIPAVGERVTGNRSAYEYLPESIRLFPPQEKLKEMMLGAGLYKVWYRNIFGGIAALHIGVKV